MTSQSTAGPISDDRPAGWRTAVSSSLRLTVILVALWFACSGPAWMLAGPAGLEGLSLAGLMMLLPGWVVFWLASRYRTANLVAATVLAGTFLRMFCGVLGIAAVRSFRPGLGVPEFVIWVAVFYLAALAVETRLILQQSIDTTTSAG